MRTNLCIIAICCALCLVLVVPVNTTAQPKDASYELPPQFGWMSYMDVYERLADAIVHERAPDFKGIPQERVDAAYAAIFRDPRNPWSRLNPLWFSMLENYCNMRSNQEDRYISVGWGRNGDPLFARYKDKKWESAYVLVLVSKWKREEGYAAARKFGIVITPPEPKTPEPTKKQTQ